MASSEFSASYSSSMATSDLSSGHGRREVFRLRGLSDKSPFHELRFEDLTEADQRKLRSSVLRAVNIKQLSPSSENTSVYHIFERLNTGGTALKPQEIRNCVYRGPIIRSLRTLNRRSSWRKLLGKNTSDRHQRDVELVLRLFSLFEDWKEYEKPMKEYLSESMKANVRFNSQKAKRFTTVFPKATQSVLKALGEKPFGIRGPLNSSVLNSVMCVVLENKGIIPADFDKRYRRLVNDEKFEERVRGATTDTIVVHDKIKIAKRHLID